jgi:2-enoate reductase
MFPLEIIKNIKEAAGKDFPVIYRYGASHYLEGGRTIEESLQMAKRLEFAGVDALDVDAGCYDNWYWAHPPISMPPGCSVNLAEMVKNAVKIPVINAGKLAYPQLANSVLSEKKADFVAIGRGLLADPEWPIKVKEGRFDDIRPCIGCHDGCMARITTGSYLSCSVNPVTGNEKEYMISKAEKPKTVLIIGGGVAGMEAARVSTLRGHKVTLYEKGDNLGGHLIEGSAPADKYDLGLLKDYYVNLMKKMGIVTKLKQEVTLELAQEINPDAVIIATGSTHLIPNIPGIDNKRVITAIDLLLGKKKAGNRVVIVGGGSVGCETAIHLAQHGKRVTIIEMLDDILPEGFDANKQQLFKMLVEFGVSVFTGMKLVSVKDKSAVVINQSRRYQAEIPADTIVIAIGLKPQLELMKALEGKVKELYSIGDCTKAGRVIDAIWGAFNVAREL